MSVCHSFLHPLEFVPTSCCIAMKLDIHHFPIFHLTMTSNGIYISYCSDIT